MLKTAIGKMASVVGEDHDTTRLYWSTVLREMNLKGISFDNIGDGGPTWRRVLCILLERLGNRVEISFDEYANVSGDVRVFCNANLINNIIVIEKCHVDEDV